MKAAAFIVALSILASAPLVASEEPAQPDVTLIEECTTLTDPGHYALNRSLVVEPAETCLILEGSGIHLDGAGHTIAQNGTAPPFSKSMPEAEWAVAVLFNDSRDATVRDLHTQTAVGISSTLFHAQENPLSLDVLGTLVVEDSTIQALHPILSWGHVSVHESQITATGPLIVLLGDLWLQGSRLDIDSLAMLVGGDVVAIQNTFEAPRLLEASNPAPHVLDVSCNDLSGIDLIELDELPESTVFEGWQRNYYGPQGPTDEVQNAIGSHFFVSTPPAPDCPDVAPWAHRLALHGDGPWAFSTPAPLAHPLADTIGDFDGIAWLYAPEQGWVQASGDEVLGAMESVLLVPADDAPSPGIVLTYAPEPASDTRALVAGWNLAGVPDQGPLTASLAAPGAGIDLVGISNLLGMGGIAPFSIEVPVHDDVNIDDPAAAFNPFGAYFLYLGEEASVSTAWEPGAEPAQILTAMALDTCIVAGATTPGCSMYETLPPVFPPPIFPPPI